MWGSGIWVFNKLPGAAVKPGACAEAPEGAHPPPQRQMGAQGGEGSAALGQPDVPMLGTLSWSEPSFDYGPCILFPSPGAIRK